MGDSILDCGVIKRKGRPISRDEWNRLVESHPALQQVPDRYGTSPFTGEKVLFSGDGVAVCIIDGQEQKDAWLKYFDGKVSITNLPEHFCNHVGALLQATVHPGMDAYSEE